MVILVGYWGFSPSPDVIVLTYLQVRKSAFSTLQQLVGIVKVQ